MTTEEIVSYCTKKKEAYVDFPFGEIPICIKVCKKLFAQIYSKPLDHKITLKCDRLLGELYRSKYPNTVVRGYHCPPVQQPYWNTVYLNGTVSDDELKLMIDHAYKVVVCKLPKPDRKRLLNED